MRRHSWRFDPRKFFFENVRLTVTDEKARKRTEESWAKFFSVHNLIQKELAGASIAGVVAGIQEAAYFGQHSYGWARLTAQVKKASKSVFNPSLLQVKAYEASSASTVPDGAVRKTDTLALKPWSASVEYDLEYAEDATPSVLNSIGEAIGMALSGEETTSLIKSVKEVADTELAAGGETTVIAGNGPATLGDAVEALVDGKWRPPFAYMCTDADFRQLVFPTHTADTTAGRVHLPTIELDASRARPETGYVGYVPKLMTHVYVDANVGADSHVFSPSIATVAVLHEVELRPYTAKGVVGIAGSLRSIGGLARAAGEKTGVQRINGALS